MKYKVLVIDDDVAFANNLARELKQREFDVRSVNSADEATREMRQWRPSIALLDLVMPGKDGRQWLTEKRADADISSIPVIMVSSSNDPKNIDMALTLGVRDYISKEHLDVEELAAKIKIQLDSTDSGVENKPADLGSQQTPPNASLTGLKILWVEDDTYLSDIISRKLSSEGCTLIHTATGEQALESVARERPDIILLDIVLPGMNGFEVLEKIRANPALKNVPIIMTSNLGQKDDIERCERLGAQKFLVKATVTLDEIIAETKRVLLQSRSA